MTICDVCGHEGRTFVSHTGWRACIRCVCIMVDRAVAMCQHGRGMEEYCLACSILRIVTRPDDDQSPRVRMGL